ncbi:putative metallophosphoesterase YkuE [Halobacillus andaensis]|uniref:Metallophosphoesterase YkuE n=2 Tax=Halobacillus andaensis TaxID=1176239 RepID=A0A917ET78_HALAA|nr:putative metallophosphoesterase YkuE [Halobacillus andaensis]
MTMTRRRFLKNIVYSVLGFLGLSGGGYYYARYMEPAMLTTQTHTWNHPKIPTSFNQVKIVQFSDIHLGFHYSIDQFKDLIQKLKAEKPDLLVFTGDLVDEPQRYHFSSEIPSLLNELEAPLGKFWIYGNHDHGGYGTEKLEAVMSKGGFTLLKNEVTELRKDGESISLAGLDDIMLGSPNISGTLNQLNDDTFSILLVHEPDIADRVKDYPVDVQLSGHSHGGQVRIPVIGSMVTPPYGEKYVDGKHLISDRLTLYISRGIGTTRMPYRFLCKPEYSVYTLSSNP